MNEEHYLACLAHCTQSGLCAHWNSEKINSFARFLAELLPVPGMEIGETYTQASEHHRQGIARIVCPIHSRVTAYDTTVFYDGGAVLCGACVSMLHSWWRDWPDVDVEKARAEIVLRLLTVRSLEENLADRLKIGRGL